MAKYRVLTRSFINLQTFEPGDEVEYDGEPADNLEPICKEAKAAFAQAMKSNVPTGLAADWNPVLGISDAKTALAGTSAANNKTTIAAADMVISGRNQAAGAPLQAMQ